MNYFLKTTLILIFLFFSYNINASEITTHLSPQCSEVIKEISLLEDEIDIKNIDIIENCSGDIFIYNLSNKILHLLYGENVKTSLSILSTLFTIDEEYFDKFFVNDGHQELLSNVITTITKIINYVAFLLFGIIYAKMLFLGQSKITSSGSIDSQFVKNNLKFFIGFSLLLPLEIFNDFSLIQTLVIFIIILATFFGNLVWISSIFLIEIMSITQVPKADLESYTKSNEYYELKANVENNIYKNINTHICDINTIEKVFDKTLLNKNESELFNNDIYKCLKDNNSIEKTYNKIPVINRSHYCLEKNNIIKEYSFYCGTSTIIDEETEIVKEANNFYTNYQENLREIAKEIFFLECKKNNENNLLGVSSKFHCIEQDISFNYSFSNEQNNFLSITKENELKYTEEIVNIKEKIDTLIDNTLITLSKPLLDKVNDDTNSDKIKSIIMSSLKSGWLGSNSIYFSSTSSPNIAIEGTDYIGRIFEHNYTPNNIHTGTINSPANDLNRKSDYEEILSNASLLKTEEEKSSDIFDVFNLNKIIMGNNKNRTDCFISSGEICNSSNLNPFYKIINQGQTMVSYSAPIITAYTVIGILLDKIDLSIPYNINLLNKFTFLIKLTLFIGMFLSFILPLIPFFIFCSVVVGWIYNTIKTLISIQYLSLLFLIPDENEDFEGIESNLYKILISIFIQPFFIVLGLIVSFILIHFSIALVNGTFSIIIGSLNISDDPSSIIEYIENVIGLIIYLVITTLLVIKSCSAIYLIPKSIQKWFDLNVDNEEGMFQQLRGVAEKIIFFKP